MVQEKQLKKYNQCAQKQKPSRGVNNSLNWYIAEHKKSILILKYIEGQTQM